MISDNISCMDLMEPEVAYKMDGAIIGGKVEKRLFLYIEKLRDSESLKTDVNI